MNQFTRWLGASRRIDIPEHEGLAHGLGAYVKGQCRCPICRDAQMVHQRRMRAQRIARRESSRFEARPDMDGAWRLQAACRGMDPSLFVELGRDFGLYQAAKDVCWHGGPGGGECPVRETCLAVAVADPNRFGVWGGVGERERRKMRREAKAGKQ